MTTNPLIDRAAFLAFVLEQPQDEHYNSGSIDHCALARFLRERCGVPTATVFYGYSYLDGSITSRTELDHGVEAAVYNCEGAYDEDGDSWNFLQRKHQPIDNFTWGALATRLQAL